MIDYAVYIWPCYILAFCLLGAQVIFALVAWKKCLKSHRDKDST